MARGSVRKKGKKWYYRFYVEDESGRRVQKEYAGSESKAETEAMLRKAMDAYEASRFITSAENYTVGDVLDMWVEEELKPGDLSNGTLSAYMGAIKRIKKDPLGDRRVKTVTADHLQAFIDFMSYGGTRADGTFSPPVSKSYLRQFSAVLQGAFRFAVFPKRLIIFNPMQYVKLRGLKNDVDIFAEGEGCPGTPTITHRQYLALTGWLEKKNNSALLPIQIAYYSGLRIGEVCGLTWQDVDLEEQYLTVRRSMRYNGARNKMEFGTTKRNKVRTVDFGATLAAILRKAKERAQNENHTCRNCYKTVKEKGRVYYEIYRFPAAEPIPKGCRVLDLVCVRPDGAYEGPGAVSQICSQAKKHVSGLDDFHFHMLRHTYTSNLLAGGAKPMDVQELLGHANVNTTMSIYAHATRKAKRSTAQILDKVFDGA